MSDLLIGLGAILVFLGMPLLIARRLDRVSSSYRQRVVRRLRSGKAPGGTSSLR